MNESAASSPSEERDASSVELTWDMATTPLEAIERALYAMADRVTGAIVDADGSWRLTAYARGTASDGVELAHRLRQEVNDQTLRLRIAERTDPLRNLVFALAFSRSGLVDGVQAAAEEAAR